MKSEFESTYTHVLRNGPGKIGGNFLCYGAICFPHIGVFSFLHRESINLQKGSLQNKTSLNSIFKGCLVFEGFRPIIRVANNSQEKFTV